MSATPNGCRSASGQQDEAGQGLCAIHQRLTVHYLPGYAPDLNPDELVWSGFPPISGHSEIGHQVACATNAATLWTQSWGEAMRRPMVTVIAALGVCGLV